MKRIALTILTLMLTMLLVSAANSPASANSRATITVTSAANSGAGTLRQAILDAQDGDTILFDATMANDTIVLTSDLPNVNKRLTIDGEDRNVTVQGAADIRSGFQLTDGADVTVRHLTFDSGNERNGGAFYGFGGIPESDYLIKLAVQHCTFTNNSADSTINNNSNSYGGAINLVRGVLSVEDSTFDDNSVTRDLVNQPNSVAFGGAIGFRGGTFTVERSTFTDNSAEAGGAIYSTGFGTGFPAELTVIDSTFRQNSGNSTTDGQSYGGGAIHGSVARDNATLIRGSYFADNETTGSGGAINLIADGARVENSTFHSNDVTGADNQGGGFYGGLRTTLSNVTVSSNTTAGPAGGGVSMVFTGNLIENSIVANNTANGIADDCTGRFSSGAVNVRSSLIERNSSTNPCVLVADSGNITSDDPELSNPANNGGPTFTRALQNDSPALDAGDAATCLTNDQRGNLRAGGSCDMGAYEVSIVRCGTHDGTTERLTFTGDALRTAVALAPAGATIKVAGICDGTASAGGANQVVYLDKDITLEGGHTALDWSKSADLSQYPTLLDAESGGNRYVVNIASGNDVTLTHLQLQNGSGLTGQGGGVRVSGNSSLTLTHSIVRDNVSLLGGGVYAETATVLIENSTLTRNRATIQGAGLGVYSSQAMVRSSTIANNYSDGSGGGVYNSGTLTMENSTVSGNVAVSGGAIGSGNNSAVLLLNHVTMASNSGGGISNSGVLTMTNSISADSPTLPNCANISSGTSSITSSIIEDGGCDIIDGNNGNRVGDPDLDLLIDNGGATQTHAIPTSSIATNTGSGLFALATDQRGFGRGDGSPDMGAYELDAVPTAVSIQQSGISHQSDATPVWSAVLLTVLSMTLLAKRRRH